MLALGSKGTLRSVRSRGDGVIATIFGHEVRRLLDGFRFHATALIVVLVMVIAGVTCLARYHHDVREREVAASGYAARLDGVTIDSVVELLHPAIKSPWRLALLVDGGQGRAPDIYAQALSAWVEPELSWSRSRNDRLPDSPPLDWMFALRVVLSLAAFVLCHDAICGERQRGTLKLLLSYPAPRWKVLVGKLLAAWSCLAAPFLLGAATSLFVLAVFGGVRFAGQDLGKIGLVTLLCLWAIALFAAIALLVSSLSRESATSLSVLALLWVTAVVVVPAAGGLLAHRLRPILTPGEIELRLAQVRARIDREHGGHESNWRPPEWASADDFAWERASARAQNRRYALKEGVRREVLDRKLEQVDMARSLAALSPMSLVQDLAERLTGTGSSRDRSFLEQARALRRPLADRLRALDAADPASPHVLFFSGYLSRRSLSSGAIPRFTFRERSLREGLRAAKLPALVLGLETILVAAAALLAFSRYDAG